MTRRPTARLSLHQLEDRTTPATVVYASDAWLGVANGTIIADADPTQPGDQPAEIGRTAFYNLTLAFAAFTPAGKHVYSFGGFSSGFPATVAAGSAYHPGGAGGTEWARHTSGITFSPGAVFAVDLNGSEPGTGYDRLTVFGTANIDGAVLQVDSAIAPGTGGPLTILGGGSVVGTFAGLPDGATVTASNGGRFTIRYTADAVILEPISGVAPVSPLPVPPLPVTPPPPPWVPIPPIPVVGTPPTTLLRPIQGAATGAAAGRPPEVVVYDQFGAELRRFLAYHDAFFGGVNVAVGDVTGDGVADVITAAGAGGGPHVKVFDGMTFEEVRSFYAYHDGFLGGVSLAVADVTGDGVADIVTGAGAGGGPHLKVFDGRTLDVVRSFYAYDPRFAGGVSVAVAPTVRAFGVTVPPSGKIVTGAGAGGSSHVKVFDADTLRELASFYAYDPAFAGGVNVATNTAGWILTGAGPGGGPHLKVFGFDGVGVTEAASTFTGPAADTGGVRASFDADSGVRTFTRRADGEVEEDRFVSTSGWPGSVPVQPLTFVPDAAFTDEFGAIGSFAFPLVQPSSFPPPDDSFL